MFRRKIQVADGFTLLNEQLWVVYKEINYDIGKCHIIRIHDDFHKKVEISVLFVDGTSGEVELSRDDLKRACYKSYENAELRKIELILCGDNDGE